MVMKKFEILRELLKCDTETCHEQMLLEKWHPLCFHSGLPQTFNLFKKKPELSVKHNKSENAVKQGMPLCTIWQSGSFATKSQAVFPASSSTASSLSIYFSHKLVIGCQTCYVLYTAVPFPLREMPCISPTKVLPFITSFCLYNAYCNCFQRTRSEIYCEDLSGSHSDEVNGFHFRDCLFFSYF